MISSYCTVGGMILLELSLSHNDFPSCTLSLYFGGPEGDLCRSNHSHGKRLSCSSCDPMMVSAPCIQDSYSELTSYAKSLTFVLDSDRFDVVRYLHDVSTESFLFLRYRETNGERIECPLHSILVNTL